MRLVTAREMAEIDRRAAAEYGIPGLLLMEHAGAAVARAAAQLAPGGPVAVLAGPGNNGGDGFVAARHLANADRRVTVFCTADRERYREDAAANLAILERLGIPVRFQGPTPGELQAAALVVDALLGTGARGVPRGAVAQAIRSIGSAGRPVLAVDIPSGLDADTGEAWDPAVRAGRTVTFGLAKRGHFLGEGPERCGELVVADISLPRPLLEETPAMELTTPEMVRALLPPQGREDHKGSRGRALVVAGGPGFLGAARLAAAGAVRAGAGLVTLAVPLPLWEALSAGGPWEVLTRGLAADERGAVAATALPEVAALDQGVRAVLIGPGLTPGEGTAALVRGLLEQETQVPLVLDADALNVLAGQSELLARRPVAITPHPGEMGRLLGITSEAVQRDRVGAAFTAARELRCVVVLKGAGTLIADPGGKLYLNPTGNPVLATGGTGDVLGGMLAALAAQGIPLVGAAVCAAYLHGLAADLRVEREGRRGFAAGDLLAWLGEAFRRVEQG
ncbi:MAG: NAD(P)H-hydrate dehydratase [Thermaerobacter sp.]|jgi:NAD(P)H-hydrate epimerase|nr:NAD(P)H-hydrate dehydratase [Thermaerobacter sp.]